MKIEINKKLHVCEDCHSFFMENIVEEDDFGNCVCPGCYSCETRDAEWSDFFSTYAKITIARDEDCKEVEGYFTKNGMDEAIDFIDANFKNAEDKYFYLFVEGYQYETDVEFHNTSDILFFEGEYEEDF